MNVIICALYHFVRLSDPESLRQPLQDLMAANALRGTLLLAHEGINGTIAGSREAVDTLIAWLTADERFADLACKESSHEHQPFLRAKVKVKEEIVTMGVADIDPGQIKGTYVKPRDWNALIADPDVTVIDTRNDYEVRIGSFRHAINPHLQSFRQFPDYVRTQLDPGKHRKIAMFCTGGIRCEKSTAYLKTAGFDEVYHLQGGILKYLEEVDSESSLWQGECFVFDERVTVDHALKRGSYDQCHACRTPVSDADMQSPAFVRGVSCPHCVERQDATRQVGLRERERQIRLAKARGEAHIGADAATAQHRRKADKLARRTQGKQ
jgi:UPF0176 protein